MSDAGDERPAALERLNVLHVDGSAPGARLRGPRGGGASMDASGPLRYNLTARSTDRGNVQSLPELGVSSFAPLGRMPIRGLFLCAGNWKLQIED
jgi:hypothetical protein